MTLFITKGNRQLEIHDAYVLALAFLIGVALAKIVKAVIEKRNQKTKKYC